jgi:hypothetical protein
MDLGIGLPAIGFKGQGEPTEAFRHRRLPCRYRLLEPRRDPRYSPRGEPRRAGVSPTVYCRMFACDQRSAWSRTNGRTVQPQSLPGIHETRVSGDSGPRSCAAKQLGWIAACLQGIADGRFICDHDLMLGRIDDRPAPVWSELQWLS